MQVRVVLVSDGRVVAAWDVDADDPPDLALVDRLARAQLVARRRGYALRVENAGDDLLRLLDLVGLRVEVGGQPERGEQRGVEEVVMPDDPVA